MRGAGAAFAAGGDLGPEAPGSIKPTASQAAGDPRRGGVAGPGRSWRRTRAAQSLSGPGGSPVAEVKAARTVRAAQPSAVRARRGAGEGGAGTAQPSASATQPEFACCLRSARGKSGAERGENLVGRTCGRPQERFVHICHTRCGFVKEHIRVAVIGAGDMANSVHYPALASFPDVEIAAICDVDPLRLQTTADRYHVAGRYADYRRMVEAVAPDGVYAIGQPQYMYDVWIWCLQHGCNLYIEKPMGLSWHQAQMLAHLAESRRLITQVSHQRRSSPLLMLLRQECLRYGPIVHAICEFYKHDLRPMLGARDHMLDDCTHAIDTVRWMCGGRVSGVESCCRRVGTPDINWIGAVLHFDNGSTGYVVNSWCSGRRVFRVEMHAMGVCVDADVEGRARLYVAGDHTGVEYDAQQVAGSAELYVYGGFQAKNREFIDSLKGGQEVTSSPFRDCLQTMEVAERILGQALARGD